MSESAGQARSGSTREFTPKFPESMRDTQQRHTEPKPVTVEDVFALIQSHEPITRTQLAVRLGVKPLGLNTFLSQLKSTDKVFQNGDGAYLLTEIAAIPALSGEQQSTKDATEEALAAAILPENSAVVPIEDHGSSNHKQPIVLPDESTQTESDYGEEAPMFDAELSAALDLIERRLSEPKGIKPLNESDIRIVALRKLMPMLADDIAEQIGSLTAYVTAWGAHQ